MRYLLFTILFVSSIILQGCPASKDIPVANAEDVSQEIEQFCGGRKGTAYKINDEDMSFGSDSTDPNNFLDVYVFIPPEECELNLKPLQCYWMGTMNRCFPIEKNKSRIK